MPRTKVLGNGPARHIISAMSAMLVAFTLVVAIPVALPDVGSTAEAATTNSCGVDVVLVLDASGSMAYNGNEGIDAVRDGVDAFISQLDTVAAASRVGIVRFGVPADADIPYTSVGSSILSDYINNVGGTGYRVYPNPDQFTNWDAALQTATTQYTAADAVIFITDGNPNRSQGTNYPDNVAGWNAAANAAVPSGNALKAKTNGTVYGIGAGSDFTGTSTAGDPVTPLGRLELVVDSGDVTSFDQLEESLPALIAAICAPKIDVEKTTNGEQADSAPGPTIPASDPVNWEYTVTNTGQLTLYDVTVTDDNNDGATITCPDGNGSFELDPGESTTCSASSLSWYAHNHELHKNTATATGTPFDKPSVTDSDVSHYTPILVCPFDSDDGIVIDIFADDPSGDGGFMLGAPGRTPNSVGPITGLDIPAGSYNVMWASYDAHSVKGVQGQADEDWYLDFNGVTSGVTDDIPGSADFAQGTLDAVLKLDADQDSVMVRHGGPADTTNSVYAICAVLDPIDPAGIGITKTLTTQGDLNDGDVATFDVTIDNSSGEESLTVTSLTENIGGSDIDLLAVPDADGLASNTCNDDLPITVAPNGSVDCSFSIVVSFGMTSASDDRCDPNGKIDVVTGIGEGDETETESSDDDCADIRINPEITVEKTVVTSGEIHDGDSVTFQVKITNDTEMESVTIDSLTENIGGADIDLLANPAASGLESNTCNTNPTISIAASGDFTCEFSIVATTDMTSAANASCPNGGKVDVVEADGSGDTSGKDVSDDDCAEIIVGEEPGGSLAITKLVYDAPSGTWVEQTFLPSGTVFPATVTWQITVENPSQWVVENLYLTDPNAPACTTEFTAALEAIASGKTSLDPGESVTFTCESTIDGTPAANTATAGGTDIWERPLPEVTDSASVSQVLASGTIGDTVWYDTNANGVQDGTEAGIAGTPVKLVGNSGQDVDPVTAGIQTTLTMTTNASGKYLFSGLPSGSYTVSVELSSVPNTQTQPLRFTTSSSFNIDLPDGGSVLTADFGVVADTLPVTGMNTDTIVLLALALLAAGVLGVLLTRRKEDG